MPTLRDLAPGYSGALSDLAPGSAPPQGGVGGGVADLPTNYAPDPRPTMREFERNGMNQIEKGYRSGRITDQANWLANQEALAAASGDTRKAASLRDEITSLQQEAAYFAPREQDVTKLGWDPARIVDWAGGAIGSTAASMQDGLVSGAGLRGAAAAAGLIPHPLAQGASKLLGGASIAVPFATNYLSNAGETYNEMANDKALMASTTPMQRLATGAGAGLVMGALDTIGDASLLRRGLGGTMGSKTIDTALDAGGFAGRFVKDNLLEGVTEVAQTGVQKAGHSLLNPNRDTSGDVGEYINSFAQAAVGGMPMSAAGNAVQSARETLQNRVGPEADKAAGSKRGDEIDLRTGKTTSGADAPAEDIIRAAASAPTHKFTAEQQARRDLLDGSFDIPDDPIDLELKTTDRWTGLKEELARQGAKPEAQKLMTDLDAVDLSDPLANEHPAMKAAADFVRPYAGLDEEQLAKAMKSVSKRGRKLSTYEPDDPRDSGMLGEAGPNVAGVDTSKMAPTDPKKFAAQQRVRREVQRQIEENAKNAAGLLEYALVGGETGKRAPAAQRNALRQMATEIANMAHIKGQPEPGELFAAERYGRIIGSLLKEGTPETLQQVGYSTGAQGSPLFSALLGAAVRASGRLDSTAAKQERINRDTAANQLVSLIPKDTLTALMEKGVNLQGDENQRHFMLDGLESFFYDGEGPFTEKKLTSMLGKETLGKLREFFTRPIEARFDQESAIDEGDLNDVAEAQAAEADEFVKQHASNAVDRSSPERLVFAHGRRDTTEDARAQFSGELVGKVREALKRGTGLTGVKLPSIARMPELDEAGEWSAEDMLSTFDPEAKDIELPARGDDAGTTAVLPANSKLWRVAKYATERFAGNEETGEQPTHAVRLSTVKEELDAAGVHPNSRLDLMLGYLLAGKKINDADAQKLSRDLRHARATRIMLDKINRVLTDTSAMPLRDRAAKLLQPERVDPAGKVIPSDLQRAAKLLPEADRAALSEARQGSSQAERLRTTLLALAKGLTAAADARSQGFKESLGLHVEAGDVDQAVNEFFNNRFQVVAEQKTNRDHDKMSAQDIKRMTDSAQGRLDAAEKAGIGLEPEAREQARRKVLAEEGTILFMKGSKELAIRAHDLVNWSRNALFSTTASKEVSKLDKATREGYLNHLSQGIAALLDSGHASNIYTYGWDGRLGKESRRAMKWPLGARQDHQKQRRFPGSFPIEGGVETKTIGQIQYGRDKRAAGRMGDGQLLDPMERSLLDIAAADERSEEAARKFQDGERKSFADLERADPEGDGYAMEVDRNEGLERDLEERAYLKRQKDIQWAAKTTAEDQAGTVPMNPDFAPKPVKGPDGKFQNPTNPEVKLNPEQAKADQQRASWLRGEINRLKALHLSGGPQADRAMRRIVALSQSLKELDARGKVEGPGASARPASWGEQLADPNAPIQVREHKGSGYAARTRENANAAGATVAIAADFTTPGEKLTASAAGNSLLQIDINTKPQDAGRQLAEHMRKLGADTLNVAGNGIYTLAVHGFDQARVNKVVHDILAVANKIWPIKGIVSGGQTGVDIAGAVAAKVLGIPATITLPKGYRQRGVDGVDANHTRAQIGAQILDGAKALGWQPPAGTQAKSERAAAPAQAKPVNVWYGSGENAELSNLAARPFEAGGRKYLSVEHAYQSWKSGKFDQATYDKYQTAGRKIAGTLGTKTEGGWNVRLMERLVKLSFEQNPTAAQALLATGDAPITHTQDAGVWKTEFPRILEKVRSELASKPAAARPTPGQVQATPAPTSMVQAAKAAAAQDSWNDVPTDRKLSAYEPDPGKTAQERPDPLTQPTPSDEDLERVRAHLGRMLGDKIKVVFEKTLDAQGEWVETDKTIRLAISSVMPMLSTANHEALHAFFSGVLANHPGAKETLLAVATDARNLGRVEAILAKGKDGNKAAIEAMRASPEEALAYTFQFWAEGLLPIDKKPQGFFQKIQRFLREVFGLVRDSEKALEVFQALYDGKMAEPSAAQKALDGIMASGERGKRWRQKTDKQLERMRSMVMTSHHMMRNSESAAMRDIAAKFFTNAGSTKLGTEPGILNRRDTESKKWATEFQLLLKGLSQEDIASMAKHDNEHKWEDHPDPELNKRLRALYAMTRRFREDYLLPAGIELGMRDVQELASGGEDHRYTPMVWSVQTLIDKKDDFFAMLKQERYNKTMNEMLATMRQVKPDAEADDVIDAIYQLLIDRNGVEEVGKLDAQREDGVLSPFFASENARKLDWITQEDRGPFLSQDLIYKMTSYLHQGVRAAEYVRTWGPGGKMLKELLVREGDVTGIDAKGEPITATADGPFMRELREAAAAQKIPADKVEDWVQRRYDDETRAVGAIEGVLGKDISESMRKLNSGLMAYQNARLLPLAVFSSMLDPNNILVSGGKLDDMIYAYLRGMKAVWRTWKDLASGTELKPEEDRDALDAMAVGAIDNNVFLERQGNVQVSEYMTNAAHRFNSKFFLANGLTMWDRQMRISATRAGMKFIERNLKGVDADSERKLQALGLPADKAVTDKDGRLVVDPRLLATQRAQELAGAGWEKATPAQRKQWALNQLAKARDDVKPQQEAVKRFVQRSVLSPNAAQRPAWASDPHYAALFHLKSFTYSFQETILQHAREEAEAGNYRPGMQLLAGIPIMIAADITKALITGGGSLPGYMANWGVADWVLHGIGRAGMSGVGEIGLNAWGDPTSLLGPTVDQISDTIMDPGKKFGSLDMVPGLRIIHPNIGLDVFDHADW